MADRLNVLVSFDPTHPGGVERIAEALRSAGLEIDDVLGELGTITGKCADEAVPALSRVPGVTNVESGRGAGIAPPGSPVQ
jgi:hypothetical protein